MSWFERLKQRLEPDADHPLRIPYTWAKRIVITLIGATILAIGIAMIVLPGPALIVIPLGLAVLGLEYAWARRWLRKMKVQGGRIAAAAKERFR